MIVYRVICEVGVCCVMVATIAPGCVYEVCDVFNRSGGIWWSCVELCGGSWIAYSDSVVHVDVRKGVVGV